MNKRQKLVQQQFLKNEEAIIKHLRTAHATSLRDITKKVEKLQNEFDELAAIYDTVEDEAQREVLKSMQRSKVYQLKYQKAIQQQVGEVLGNLHKKDFKSVSKYLDGCYTDGFIGAMYDLQGQGLPFIFPIDQEAMVRAVQLDSKISKGLYKRLGEDVTLLKKRIAAQVSRGISTGMSFEQMAKNLSQTTSIGFNNAVRIARTEGHRIQVQSGMDACYKAKEKGADVVKQWDSTLDSRTRKSHKRVDGEIRELDEEFSNGLKFPGDPDGKAEEVIHCRCALLQRARAALDESELETLKKRAAHFGLDKADNFEDFKKKYLKAAKKESEVKEIKNALDFGYGDFTQDDYNKWWDEYEAHNSGVTLSDVELKDIEDYTEGGFIAFNDVCRYSDSQLLKKGYSVEDIARIRKRADTLDGALSKYDLDTDIVTHRFERDVSWLTGAGNDVADLEKLIGSEYTAKGFTSSGMLPNRFRFTGGKSDAVHFEIVTPKGTNGAFLSMSKKGENEFLYNRNTRFKILDGGERVIKESKLNIKTMQMEEVEITERFLKVQVIPEDLTKSVKKNKISFESIKLSGIDADYAPDIEETFIGLMDEYPVEGLHVKTNRAGTEFGHFLGGVKGSTKKGEVYAYLENEICISKSSYKDKATSAAEHLYNYKDRESALQNAARLDLATVPHEYAHAIDHAYVLAKEPELKAFADKYKIPKKITAKDVTEINDFNIKVSKSDSRLSKEIFDELQKEYGLDYMGTIMRIDEEYGHYASSSISEFLAEAFANMQILDDKDKTDFMKSFEKIFKRKYKEVLGG